jgi:general secretion pathway protein A
MQLGAYCPSSPVAAQLDARRMYHAHWGLSRSPFAGGGTPVFYEGESQAEALARLRYVAENRRHALLLGERGAGKSLLMRYFVEQRRREGRESVAIGLTGISPRELLWQVAAGLCLGPGPEDEAVRLFRQLGDYAAAAGARKSTALLLLDDADQAGADVRTTLLRVLSLGGETPWVTLVLIANTKRFERLGEELLDALDLRIELEPWSEADMVGYVQHALVEAGSDRPVFEDEALSAMYALTDGIPRKVNRLADHALLGAAADEHEMVDAAMMEAAHDALSWAAVGPA